jgi:hypothetical protein
MNAKQTGCFMRVEESFKSEKFKGWNHRSPSCTCDAAAGDGVALFANVDSTLGVLPVKLRCKAPVAVILDCVAVPKPVLAQDGGTSRSQRGFEGFEGFFIRSPYCSLAQATFGPDPWIYLVDDGGTSASRSWPL